MLPRAVLLALESQSPDTSEQCAVKARQEYIWTLRCLHTFHKCLGTLKFWITAYHKILLLLTSSWGLFSKCCVPIKYFRFCLPKKNVWRLKGGTRFASHTMVWLYWMYLLRNCMHYICEKLHSLISKVTQCRFSFKKGIFM